MWQERNLEKLSCFVLDSWLNCIDAFSRCACARRMPLECYWFKFCDLRKEVARHLASGQEERVAGLEDMLYFTMLDSCGKGVGE